MSVYNVHYVQQTVAILHGVSQVLQVVNSLWLLAVIWLLLEVLSGALDKVSRMPPRGAGCLHKGV